MTAVLDSYEKITTKDSVSVFVLGSFILMFYVEVQMALEMHLLLHLGRR